MRYLPCLLILICVWPAWGSEPGEPLSYEDWESVDTSFPLSVAVAAGNCSEAPSLRCNANTTFGIDASGLHWAFQQSPTGTCLSQQMFSLDLVRCDETLEACDVIARLNSRCVFYPVGGTWCVDGAVPEAVWIDNISGELFFRYESTEPTPNCVHYPRLREVIRVGGLPTLFEVLQTYAPSTTEISFRVPYMPEGLQRADWFDTYYGDLATVGNWSQVQPLQCGYPTPAPQVGDYLAVDAPQVPPPGQGFYYVTAVDYQGQRRYGRKASGGVLSGRDPAVLPACN